MTEWLPLTHLLVAWILLLDSVGQEFGQHMTKMACLCTTVSGTSGGKTGVTQWLRAIITWSLVHSCIWSPGWDYSKTRTAVQRAYTYPQRGLNSSHYDIIRVVRLLLCAFESKSSSQQGEAALNFMNQNSSLLPYSTGGSTSPPDLWGGNRGSVS